MDTKAIVGALIGIMLALYVGATLLPDAVDTWSAVNTSTWDDSVASLFELAPLIAILAVIVIFLAIALAYL